MPYVNTWVPDDLAQWGKQQSVNFSALLREALERERRREAREELDAGGVSIRARRTNGGVLLELWISDEMLEQWRGS
jgi:hypothetical protein